MVTTNGTGDRGGHGQAAPSAERRTALRRALGDIGQFSAAILKLPLRGYQLEIARAVLQAIERGDGHQLTVLLPRQSGKNQLSQDRPSVSAHVRSSHRAGGFAFESGRLM